MNGAPTVASVVRELAFARDLTTLTTVVRSAARRLTGADGVTFVLRDGDHCYYADEDAIAPLWKGRRFAISECVSGWVMTHGMPVAIPDIRSDERVPAAAYEGTFVRSMAMVPVRPDDPVAAIGAYWARPHTTTDEELAILCTLADASSAALSTVVALQQLSQRTAELGTVLDVLPIGVAIAEDAECRRMRGNRTLSELLGVPLDGNVSLSAPPGERPTTYTNFRDGVEVAPSDLPMQVAARTGTEVRDFEVDVVRADGGRVSLLCFARALRDESGGPRGAVGAFLDVTQRRRSQEAARSAMEQLHIVTETMAVPVTRCSRAMHYEWVSRPYATWLGLPAEAILGRHVAEVIGAEAFGQLKPYFDRVLSGERVEYEERVPFRGIGPRWVHVVYTPVFARDGRTDGWVAVVDDVEERKRSEHALLDEARRKDEFLALLGHELRNPLAPILSAVEILRLEAGPESQTAWAAGVIDRQARHLVRLVDDLLDLGRLTRGRIELRRQPVDLATVVEHAVETSLPSIRAGEHELVVHPSLEPLPLDADTVRLGQVISNVLNNAARYTPRGGHIALTLGRDGNDAVVRVRDDGRGIAPEMLDRVFDMFERVKTPSSPASEGGLGIGLTLARQLVEAHGGAIAARSEGVGRGSEFTVRIPLAASAGRSDRPAAKPVATATPRRVLVVDDHPDAAEALVLLLGTLGHEVQVAADGEQALALAREHRPHVVLLDIGLPGADGYETARRMRTLPGGDSMTLVALTGWGQPGDKEKAAAAGFDHHVTKPADPAQLSALVAASAERHR